MCISFGNPSEPCCGNAIPAGWHVAAPAVNDYDFDHRLFTFFRDGYTSLPSMRSRDVHFRIIVSTRKNDDGLSTALVQHVNPALPSRTVFGTGHATRFWSDLPTLPRLLCRQPSDDRMAFRSEVLTDWPAQVDAGDLFFGGGGVTGQPRQSMFQHRRFRVWFPGGSRPVGIRDDVLQVDPVTSQETIARQITGQVISVLCRARIIGEGYEGFGLQHLVGSDFFILIPITIGPDDDDIFSFAEIPTTLATESFFSCTGFSATSANTATVVWNGGPGGDIVGSVRWQRITR
jgi:hypothetical protein